MPTNRPFALTIAGLDPSGGAGILADCKTFEQHQVIGLAVLTANTIQTENDFIELQWMDLNFIMESIKTLFKNYPITVVKIGIVPSLSFLNTIVETIRKLAPNTKIVWDTVLKSSSNYDFLTMYNRAELNSILTKIDLITPNYDEIQKLYPNYIKDKLWTKNELPTAILVKGGHNKTALGTDYLFIQNEIIELPPTNTFDRPKHGSGCVLSAAIAANLALGKNLKEACTDAKLYIEKYLSSSSSLIGYHYAS